MSTLELRCPACARSVLHFSADAWTCEACEHQFARTANLDDLRVTSASCKPLPLESSELEELLLTLDNGAGYRAGLEAFLLDTSAEKADRLMLLLGEGRGSWHPLTRVTGGRALWLGNAFSGSWLPLAQAGFEVLVVDPCPARVRFAKHRVKSQPTSAAQFMVAGDSEHLPFANEAFDLVIQEEGLPGPAEVQFAHTHTELLRVTRGECFMTAENRFAYKRSTGRRAKFRVPSPLRWLGEALAPAPGRKSRNGHEKALLSDAFEAPKSHALYPHMRDFTHVVDLDGGTPELPIGPLERKNRLKIIGQGLGLFPTLTPSFVTGTTRSTANIVSETRMQRVLRELSSKLGEAAPNIENWTATRGNCAVILTHARPGEVGGDWALHVPMNEKERRELSAHDEHLQFLRMNHPGFPIPEPLFSGTIDGLWLSCERRLGGIAATQVSREPGCAKNLLTDVAQHLTELIMQHATPLSDGDLDRLLGSRFDRVGAKANLPETIAHVERAREKAIATLRGLKVPRVFYHSDIRSKHVRVNREGHVLGYLDFGCSSRNDLPYFDLINLVVHENKRDGEFASTNAWQRLLTRNGLREHELAALDSYATALSLPPEYCRTIEEIYPILVVAMCERNWDYSRPRWLHEHFGY